MFASIKLPGQAHTVNPVLDAFRECVVANGAEHTAEIAAEWQTHFVRFWHYWSRGRIPARKAHREHAKKVFARLANCGTVELPTKG